MHFDALDKKLKEFHAIPTDSGASLVKKMVMKGELEEAFEMKKEEIKTQQGLNLVQRVELARNLSTLYSSAGKASEKGAILLTPELKAQMKAEVDRLRVTDPEMYKKVEAQLIKEELKKGGSGNKEEIYEQPTAVLKWLGATGLIPFWAFSPLSKHLPVEIFSDAVIANAPFIQLCYGALIISFLGGVHWGGAMNSRDSANEKVKRYVWSVVPSLLAWPTLLLPIPIAVGSQIAILLVVWWVDVWAASKSFVPKWYLSLRLPLTMFACMALVMTLSNELEKTRALESKTKEK